MNQVKRENISLAFLFATPPKSSILKQDDKFDPDKYSSLLAKLRVAFDRRGYRLTIALRPWQKLVPAGYAAVHGVHLKAFDLGKERHATVKQVEKALAVILNTKLPKEKLILGIPAYGRGIGKSERVMVYAEVSLHIDICQLAS